MGQAQGVGGGSGDRDQAAGAGHHGFLHHLDGIPAGQNDGARCRVHPGAGKRPDQLVQRVVAPDVFARQDNAPSRQQETGRMGGMGLVVQGLVAAQRIRCPGNFGGREDRAAQRQLRQRAQGQVEAVNAAEPQPTGPIIARRRAFSAAARSCGSQKRASMPPPCSAVSSSPISPGCRT